MAFDYKKEYKEFYLPKRQPGLVEVPPLQFLAVRGQGDPNQPDGAYKQAIALLYAAAYAIKMSKMGDYRMEGYFDFVVPPLEGLWWQNDTLGEIDYAHKERFQWLALIRLPEFVTEADFNWASAQAAKKIPDAISARYFYCIISAARQTRSSPTYPPPEFPERSPRCRRHGTAPQTRPSSRRPSR